MNNELLKKLRYKEGQAVVINAPEGYILGVEGSSESEGGSDFVQLFVSSTTELNEKLGQAILLLKEDAVFWITYPKQSSKVKTDINRDVLAGIVMDTTAYRPVSNVSIDATWSALRFRLKDKVKTKSDSGVGKMSEHAETLPDIRQTLELNAPIQKVWSAVATSEGIAAWFMPNNFQPELGYEFHLEAGPFGQSLCKVTELNPPYRLSFNWDKDWTITFELKELGEGKTEFTLIHGGWDADKATAFGEKHSIVRDRMAGGWVKLVQSLGTYVDAQ